MRTIMKRLTALILALAMCLSLLSANVWAAELETLENGSAPAQSSEELPAEDTSNTEKAPEEEHPAEESSGTEESVAETPVEEQEPESTPMEEPEEEPEETPEEAPKETEEAPEPKEDMPQEAPAEEEAQEPKAENAQPAAEEAEAVATLSDTSGTCGKNVTWTFDEYSGTLTISGSGEMENYDYATIGSYPVPWYSSRSSVQTVIINGGVTSIGDHAFSSCSSLTRVAIPDSVTSIGEAAFYQCESLTSVAIPNSVTSIGNSAFASCSSLTSVTIPGSVTSIEGYAFSSCSSLTSVTIPNSVTSIGGYAFYETPWLQHQGKFVIVNGILLNYQGDAEDVTIPDGVTSIGDYAFYCCNKLTNVTIPNSVTSIGDYVFQGCRSLTSVTIPNGVTIIGQEAFRLCTNLTRVAIPDSVTSIGGYAFYRCESLTSVAIPNSVTSIGGYAFASCSSLTSVTIGNGVTSIGKGAFQHCDSLTNVTIHNSVASIGDYAFYCCNKLTNVTIPSSVTSIGKKAFGFRWDSDIRLDSQVDNFTISGYTSSSAETYAKENYIPFTSLGTVHTHSYGTPVWTWSSGNKTATATFTCTDKDDTQTVNAKVTESTTPVTYTQAGKTVYTAKVSFDGKEYTDTKEVTIPKLSQVQISKTTVTLSDSSYTYTGKALTPAVTVKDGSTTLKVNTDYTVAYKNNTNAGTATVTITGKGNYTGTVTKTFTIKKASNTVTAADFTKTYSAKAQSFKLNAKVKDKANLTYKSDNKSVTVDKNGKVTVKAKFVGQAAITITAAATNNYNKATKKVTVTVNPTATTLSSAANVKGLKMTVKWKKNTVGTGYQVQYSTDKAFKSGNKTVTIKKNGTTSTTIAKLTKGKTYYVRIRSYKTVSKKNYYSGWSKAKSAKITK